MAGVGIVTGLACSAAIMPVLQQQVGYLGTIDHAAILWPVGLLTAVGWAKTGDQGPVHTLQQVGLWNTLLHDPASDLGRQYELVATYSLPDRSSAELYRHR